MTFLVCRPTVRRSYRLGQARVLIPDHDVRSSASFEIYFATDRAVFFIMLQKGRSTAKVKVREQAGELLEEPGTIRG